MGTAVLLVAVGFLPQDATRVEQCDILMLNHIQDGASYWVGWDVTRGDPIVDWWRQYRKELVWINGGEYWALIDGVLVKARRSWVVLATYDIELAQRQRLRDWYGMDHKKYRRGLGGEKPK